MSTRKYLKVFIDGYSLNKEYQGVNTYITEIYKTLSKQFPEYEFYLGCFPSKSIKELFQEFPNIKLLEYKNRSRVSRMLFEIPVLIKKHQFDFAHFQYVLPFSRDKRCRYVLTIHDILFNDFKSYFPLSYRIKRNILFKSSAKKADYLLTVSKFSKNRIAQEYNISKEKIIITPNGVNKLYFESYDKNKARSVIKSTYGFDQYILYVSRIEPRKNQELLINTYLNANLDESDIHLVFIGSNTLTNKKFNKILHNLTENQKKKVHHFENISQKKLIDFYKGATLFVYPSIAEGFGIPPLEAGAFNIPVLCSNRTAMSNYTFFKPYLCNPNDKHAFQHCFDLFLKKYTSIDLKEIQNIIKKCYSWHRSAEELALIYMKDFR